MPQLEMTTISASGTSNVDSVPAAVSTGYQAQNVLSESARMGVDTITFSYLTTEPPRVVIESGGVVDENGILFTMKETLTLAISESDWGKPIAFSLSAGANSQQRNIVAGNSVYTSKVWNHTKNGWYTPSGNRVLNTVAYVYASSAAGDHGVQVVFSPIGNEYDRMVQYEKSKSVWSALTYRQLELISYLSRRMTGVAWEVPQFPGPNDPTPWEITENTGISSDTLCLYGIYLTGSDSRIKKIRFNSGVQDQSWLISGNDIRGIYVEDSGSEDGDVFLHNATTKKIERWNNYGGTKQTEFNSPCVEPAGVFVYEGDLWLSDKGAAKIYQMNGISGTVKTVYDTAFYTTDISIHNGTLIGLSIRDITEKEDTNVYAVYEILNGELVRRYNKGIGQIPTQVGIDFHRTFYSGAEVKICTGISGGFYAVA